MSDIPEGRPRSSWLLLDDYPTRILLGFLWSLGILLVVLNLPMDPGSPPIGWSLRTPEQIPISEFEQSDESSEDASKEDAKEKGESESQDPPPPTHFPTAQSQASTSDGSGTEPGQGKTDDRESSPSEDQTVPIATLASDDHKPELIGGKGSLYLQIGYPYEARRKGIEGRLKLRFTVTPQGDVRRIEVENPLHPLCDSAAVRALRSVRFRPAKRRGEPVPVRMSLPIRFELETPDTTSFRTSHRGSGP